MRLVPLETDKVAMPSKNEAPSNNSANISNSIKVLCRTTTGIVEWLLWCVGYVNGRGRDGKYAVSMVYLVNGY